MIIALAGRRVDRGGAKESRFPLQNIELVRTRLRMLLESLSATLLISSAACGADLIAQSEAGHLGMERRVILPFDRKRFRETSVTDRPGDWGPVYDQLLDAVEAAGGLVNLEAGANDDAFALANRAILEQALSFGEKRSQAVTAVLVWNGVPRGGRDLTASFGEEARRRGLPVSEILTV